MDLNYLLHRHQVSLMRAEAAASLEGRRAHGDLAQGYAARIASLRLELGAPGALVVAA